MSARIAVVVAGAFLAAGSAAAQWEVDATGSNASTAGLGGGLMYVCASNAPSRGGLSTRLHVSLEGSSRASARIRRQCRQEPWSVGHGSYSNSIFHSFFRYFRQAIHAVEIGARSQEDIW